jgi:hypothetical protein
LDNTPCHADIQNKLKNVTVKFLPPNTTSATQPLDSGIIRAMKLKFRTYQMNHVLALMEVDRTLTGAALLKKVNLLDAITWVSKVCKDISPLTVQKCFAQCGFVKATDQSQTTDPPQELVNYEEEVPPAILQASINALGVPLQESDQIDIMLSTCDENLINWDASAQDILTALDAQTEVAEEREELDEDDEEEEKDECEINTNEALKMLISLKSMLFKKETISFMNP